jgi:4-alpha-glucanotransferase
MSFPRSSGILLHPTSLPGRFGIGDLGPEAYSFVDFISAASQGLWQLLPLGPPSFGNSPYQCFSAFAGNTMLISPELLVQDQLLSEDDLKDVPTFKQDRVDFGHVIEFKYRLLGKAYDNYTHTDNTALDADYESFRQFAALWLDDYATFRALKDAHGGRAWTEWGAGLSRREPKAMARARKDLGEQIEAHRFYQYLFFRQWLHLKAYARGKAVQVIGDMPIFVAHDSADVWTHPDLFKLDTAGNPTVVAGVPPDVFSETGQLWGNPLYDWSRMRATGYRWWRERVRAALQTVDIVRIDHFRGFSQSWEIPAGDETAEHGRWVDVPGRELFAALQKVIPQAPVLAEDLGLITPDVQALRDEFDLPGMRVLQFAFGGDPRDTHLPHNYVSNAVVYTGTHDNDTTVGWFNRKAAEGEAEEAEALDRERKLALRYLNSDGREIHLDFIRAALASVANMAIVPLQDLLGLDSSARMNLPASEEGNWGWRFTRDALTEEIGRRLKEMTELYGRAPY